MQAARGAGARRGVGSSSSSSGGSAGPMWMLLVLGVLLLGFVGVARAERGVGATKGFGLLDSVQQVLGLVLTGELLSKEGIQKHSDLLQHLVAEGLSVAIILGSAILKLPQILAILRSGSVVGLSLYALYFELVSGVGSVLYNVHSENPFSVYGEAVFILLQNLFLLYLLWSLAKPPVSGGHKGLALLVIGGLAAVGWWLPEHKEYLMKMQGVLLVAMKGPQLWTNYLNGHTGQLALLTVVMGLAGTLVRVFTTYKKLGAHDPQFTLFGFAAALNLALLAQMVLYYQATQRAVGGKGGKRGGAKQAAAGATPGRVTRASQRKSKKTD